MKNIFKTGLMLLCAAGLFAACEDDNDSNPTLQMPTSFTLNTPAVSANNVVDLANSSTVNLTCTQPDYGGMPLQVQYTIEMSTKADMSDAVTLTPNAPYSAKIALDGNTVASTLTTLELNQGKTEADFPMTIPVYFRAVANLYNSASKQLVENSEVKSNIVSLQKVRLAYSLPAVTAPDVLYVTGSGTDWDWNKCQTMVEVNGSRDNENTTVKFWHMVWIDDSGIKFNTAKAWDGNDVGFAGITVDAASELGSQIQASSDGNIASTKNQWYLVIVTAKVNGRNIDYTVTFNEPNVWLMGPIVGNSNWSELEPGMNFTVPTTKDGEFVSPAFLGAVPGGDGDGVRFYVKVPGCDWWKSEMIVGLDGDKISYRGNGGDQTRVAGSVGQQVHLNFSTDTGSIK